MNELISGGMCGLSQTVVGHPFDTLKVRIQNKRYNFRLPIYKYFRGIGFPIISNTIVNSILFYEYGYFKKNLNNTFLAGFISGVLCSPIIYLFDNGKALRQMGMAVNLNKLVTRSGFVSVLLRESIAFSVYFGSYEWLKNDKQMHPLISGGLSGLANWTITYPIDVIRNRQIINNISMKEAYKQGNLWRGFSICAFRAVLVNSVGFYVYELFSQ